jgi:pimeloyl-ACP methyl ester carboxylesterase
MRAARLAGHTSVPALAAALAEIRLPTPAGGTVRLGEVRDGTQLRLSARCLLSLDPAVFDPLLAGRWFDGYDEARILGRVACPVLLLAGSPERGGMLGPSAATRVQRRLAECIRVDVPEAGHLLHWTHTDTVLRLTAGFLESL